MRLHCTLYRTQRNGYPLLRLQLLPDNVGITAVLKKFLAEPVLVTPKGSLKNTLVRKVVLHNSAIAEIFTNRNPAHGELPR